MKRRLTFFMILLVGAIGLPAIGYTEMIHMRDGRVIQDKIKEDGDYYIITVSGNKILRSQIDRIEEERLEDTIVETKIDVAQFEEIGMSVVKAKLIIAMIEVSGVRKNMEENLGSVLSRVPDESKAMYRLLFNIDEIIARLVPIYDRYYTEEDLSEIIRFYKSATGQKTLEVTPEIMKETIRESAEYFKNKAETLESTQY